MNRLKDLFLLKRCNPRRCYRLDHHTHDLTWLGRWYYTR